MALLFDRLLQSALPSTNFAVQSDPVSTLADFEKTAFIFYHSPQRLSIYVTWLLNSYDSNSLTAILICSSLSPPALILSNTCFDKSILNIPRTDLASTIYFPHISSKSSSNSVIFVTNFLRFRLFLKKHTYQAWLFFLSSVSFKISLFSGIT